MRLHQMALPERILAAAILAQTGGEKCAREAFPLVGSADFDTVRRHLEESLFREKTILLLQNDEKEIFNFRRALMAARFDGRTRLVFNLRETYDYLNGVGRYADRRYYPIPHLIVIDPSLAAGDLGSLLSWLRTCEATPDVPIAIVSSAPLSAEVNALAQSYRVKTFETGGDFSAIVAVAHDLSKLAHSGGARRLD